MRTFTASVPVELQLDDYSCSVGATYWCLRSIDVAITQRELHDVMVPTLVSPADGLLDSSGATIARLLRDRFGLAAVHAGSVSFDEVARRAGQQPLLIGGRRWYVDGQGGVTGHWVAVRGFDGEHILLANPGGTGPRFGQQRLAEDDFAARGPFSAVWIGVADAGGSTVSLGRRFRVANTDGQGARLRREPSTAAATLRVVPEGGELEGGEYAWRQVTGPAGTKGWMADEFLERAGDGFRVAGTGGDGANLRQAPDRAG